MNISAVSFGASSTQNLRGLSEQVNAMKPYRSSDYTDLATSKDREIMDSFAKALETEGSNKNTFQIAIDALKKSEAVRELPNLQRTISNIALRIARKAPDITKDDVLDNFPTLAAAQHSFSHYA